MRNRDLRARSRARWLGVALMLVVCGGLVTLQWPVRAQHGGDRWIEEWSTPVNLGNVVNTAANESSPALSKDGLSLYFASNRDGTLGAGDIWVAHRETADGDWGTPVNVTMLNSSSSDGAPALSRDGHRMFFESSRPGGSGGADIWVSWRQYTHDDFGWEQPVNLGPVVNFQFEDMGPFLLEGDEGAPTELYFSSNRRLAEGFMDIVVSRLQEDGTFSAPELVADLSTRFNEMRPQLTANGREIFFMSNRPGGMSTKADIWVSTRPSRYDPWAAPTVLAAVNSPFQEGQPAISGDGRTLVFMSDRPAGAQGGQDLWVSTRTRVKAER